MEQRRDRASRKAAVRRTIAKSRDLVGRAALVKGRARAEIKNAKNFNSSLRKKHRSGEGTPRRSR